MLHKLRQQIERPFRTASNRLPNLRSCEFLTNIIRNTRQTRTSYALKASLGLFRWALMYNYHKEDRISRRASCPMTGRARGTSQRYIITRTQVKHLADNALLLGVSKSS
jgi:ribosomal protein S14